MKRILMCRPDHYDIEYVINPWMNMHNQPDPKKALDQWNELYKTYLKLGIEVELIKQPKGLPDMVYTANGGTVVGKMFVSGNYRYQERKGEEAQFHQWFGEQGYEIITLKHFQGGEGDALFYKDTLYMGYGFRSEIEAHKEMAQILQVPTVSLKLIDPYFYDFDTTFCPLGDRGVLIYLSGYDEKSQEVAEGIKGKVLMTTEQADNFIGNSVYIDGKLLVGFLDEDLKKKLFKLDIEPVLFNMSEYKKTGGGIKCLTLYLE